MTSVLCLHGYLVPGLSAVEAAVSPGFVVVISGSRSLAAQHEALFAERDAYRMPSLHIIGDTDTVVAPADTSPVSRANSRHQIANN